MDDKFNILLPGNIDAESIIKLFQDILECRKPKYKKYFFDFREIEFITPSGLTILVNVIRWLLLNECDVISLSNDKNKAIKYLTDAGFFKAFGPNANPTLQNPARRTIMPLQLLTDEQSTAWVHGAFPIWLDAQCDTKKNEVINSISGCVAELLNNIKDHSRQNISCIFGQYYPKNGNYIELAISDYGIGIPASIRAAHNDLTDDVDCLQQAIKQGVSSQSTPRNRGSGLNHIINYIPKQIEGSLVIYSGCAKLSCQNNPSEIECKSNHFFPGTAIIINIPVAKVKQLCLARTSDEKEDLIW